MHTVGVIENALAGRVVVQRIDGEVAPLGVVVERAVDVVAQNASAFVARGQVTGILVIVFFGVIGAERGDFDDLAAEMHVYQLEAAPDNPRVAEFGPYLFGGGAGGDVVVLGVEVQ
ncbi:hypothetical protein SSTU70S_01277 [Stutzerimonas stutzeri]